MKKLLYAVLLAVVGQIAFISSALASEGGSDVGTIGLGAGFAIGLAALGGGIGQGKASAAALEGISRNPSASGKIFTPFIVGLALIESLVIYAFVIAIMLFTKI